MNVARLADIPLSIIKKAQEKSNQVQKKMQQLDDRQNKIKLIKRIMNK